MPQFIPLVDVGGVVYPIRIVVEELSLLDSQGPEEDEDIGVVLVVTGVMPMWLVVIGRA